MFANSLFTDGDDVDVDAQSSSRSNYSRHSLNTADGAGGYQPMAFDRPASATLAQSMTGTGNLDGLPSTPTPAMRKAKMEEMRRAQMDKRKQKAMAAPAVLRANEDQVNKALASPLSSPSASAGGSRFDFKRQNSIPSNIGGTGSFFESGAAAAASPAAAVAGAGGSGQGSASVSVAASPRHNRGSLERVGTSPTSVDSDDDDGEGGVVGIMPMGGETLDPQLANLMAQRRAEQGRKNIPQSERDMISQGIAPVFDPVAHLAAPASSSSKLLDYSDMRGFLMNPVPKGVLFQCYILRNKKGLLNKLYPTYECYVSGEERFLMAARKRNKNKSSNYQITMDKNQVGSGKESQAYMGKVRSNFVGTEFVTYDKGINPATLDAETASVSMMSVRQELCAVFYESNILGSKGPRKMTAVVPAVRKDGHRAVWKPLALEQSVAVQYKKAPGGPDFLTMVNKTPKWNDAAGAYVLNFNGRVTQASVKNFQLISQEDPETVLLQFGRIGKDTFTLDMQWPISPMQAFSIALTSFDYKFACE